MAEHLSGPVTGSYGKIPEWADNGPLMRLLSGKIQKKK